MEEYELFQLKQEIAEEMAQLNSGTTPDMILKTWKARDEFHYFADKSRPPLVDISPLARVNDLKSVRLYNCLVSDLSPLAGIHTLESISISCMQKEALTTCKGHVILPCDFTALKELRSLLLYAARCAVPNLAGLPKLSVVYLYQINSLEGLTNQPAVREININENPDLVDLSPLATCPQLERLMARQTGIRDLSPLTKHPSLKAINVNNSKVTDVSPLSTIPTLESVWLYGTAVKDVSCLASLPKLNDLNLYSTQVTDLSAFQGRENILKVERKKLGIKKAGKDPAELKVAISEIREKLDKLGITPRPPLKRNAITVFQEKTGVKLPKEYTAFLTKVGNGFEIKFRNFLYCFPPLEQVWYDPECVKKRFGHRESWLWENDEEATEQRIFSAVHNGQLELVDCGDGASYRLIVCGGAKGEVWSMGDTGIVPCGNGLDFLDWLKNFLNGNL